VSSLVASASVQAFIVIVRMFPMLPVHKRIAAMSSSLGISTKSTKSYFPMVVKNCIFPPAFSIIFLVVLTLSGDSATFFIPCSVQVPRTIKFDKNYHHYNSEKLSIKGF